jgi:hypothetical protein
MQSFLENLIVPRLPNNAPKFKERWASLSHAQKSAIGLYHKVVESSAYPHTLFVKSHFNIIPLYHLSLPSDFFFEFFRLELYIFSPSLLAYLIAFDLITPKNKWRVKICRSL